MLQALIALLAAAPVVMKVKHFEEQELAAEIRVPSFQNAHWAAEAQETRRARQASFIIMLVSG